MGLMKYLTIISVYLIIGSSVAFADLDKAPIISKSGVWSVRQTEDFMTDEKSCVALYKDRFDIQVNEGVLYINLRGKGGVEGFRYRIDDEEPKTELASDISKEIGAVILDGQTFQQLLTAKRLRIQISTILGGFVEEDINLNGLAEVYPTLTGPKCQ